MATLTIMVIRHAEKPADAGPPFGVIEDGGQDINELVVRGWQRAGALVHLFAAPGPFSAPSRVIAAVPNAESYSLRPMHTVAPLAARAGLVVDDGFGKGDEATLAAALAAMDGVILVCWHHEAIPSLVNELVGDAATCPQKWPKHRFDVVWLLTRSAAGKPFAFGQAPQLLLGGDVADPIPFDDRDD